MRSLNDPVPGVLEALHIPLFFQGSRVIDRSSWGGVSKSSRPDWSREKGLPRPLGFASAYAARVRLPLPGRTDLAIAMAARSASLTASALPKLGQSSGSMTTAWASRGKRFAKRPRMALLQS